MKRRYVAGDNIGDGHIKAELGEVVNALLEPMRVRRARLEGAEGDAIVMDVIRRGVKKANVVAEETLSLANQPLPSGASLTLAGASTSAPFDSITSPETGL